MRYILVLLVLLPTFIYSQRKDQKHVVKGIVVEDFGDSLSAVPGAELHWIGTEIKVVSGDDGKFEIPHEEGFMELEIQAFGFTTDTITYNEEKFFSIVIRDGNLIEGVLVEFDKDRLRLSLIDPLNAHLIDQKEIRKAACCSLAESFENDPSVDASFTDAVTGTRQIEMMGLSGRYVQIMQDNIPMTRGLATVNGLEYVPGAWINSIQVSKGAGSVVNGFESLIGQINVDWKKPGNAEQLHLNVYGNQAGRGEINLMLDQPVGARWESTLLLHTKQDRIRWDKNSDGFLDNPLTSNFIGHNQWNYRGDDLHVEFGVGALIIDKLAGQVDYEETMTPADLVYGVELLTKRVQGFAKIGYLFPDEEFKSLAVQLSGSFQQMENQFHLTNYTGEQTSFNANLIFQNELGKGKKQSFRTGASFLYDDYSEALDSNGYQRTEMVPGVYFEYNLIPNSKFNMVAGIRGDYHNLYGFFYSPRLHLRYSLSEKASIKASAGKGQRTPNVFAENIGSFASSRVWSIQGEPTDPGYGLLPEVAWNFGLNLTKKYQVGIGERDGSIAIDAYHTRFENQVVVDMEDPTQIQFYNLDGQSFSNSIQAEINQELNKRMDVRLAYRFLDVRTDYNDGMLDKPFVPKHRAFINLGYETKVNEKEGNCKFDATLQYIGEQRIPNTLGKAPEFQLADRTDPFLTLNAQITKVFSKKFEIYLGGENLTNYKQRNPILSSSNPFSTEFDASLVWAPIFGRMVYGGLRWTIQ